MWRGIGIISKAKVRLRLTIVVDYEADPDHYETDDPVKMAEVDRENFIYDPPSLVDFLSGPGLVEELRVEPVEGKHE